MSQAAISIQGLRFSYSEGPVVLDVPEFSINSGEAVFLHGPSGHGKSTLLGLISGVLPIQEGRIQVLGQDLGSLSSSARDRLRGREMGYIFQMFNLLPYLSVEENIALPGMIHPSRVPAGTNAKGEARRLAESLGLGDMLQRPVHRLSIGQQQRAAAARALFGSPKLLIADEPTSALDEDNAANFMQLLLNMRKQSATTLLFVSHDKRLAGLFERSLPLPGINRAARGGE